jgi:hypothetical protein
VRMSSGLVPRSGLARLVGKVCCCVAISLIFPAFARAQAPQPAAPVDGYQHVAGSPPPTFSFAPGTGATDYLFVHVSTSPATSSTGLIGSDVTIATFSTAAPAWTPAAYTFPSYWLVTPGTYYWQPYRISFTDDPDGYQEGGIRRFEVLAPPPPPPPPPPPDYYAGLSTELIPRSIGLRAPRFKYRVSTDGTPANVGAGRWAAIADRAGARWGMKNVGRTYGRPYSGDGYVEVGWGWLRAGTLGVETDLYQPVYRRYRKPRWICNQPPGERRRCGWGRRKLVRSRLIDADLVMSRRVPWQPGPAYPSDTEYDLESVVLHEMGHLAGNSRHARLCKVTPMVEALDTGEWWRSTADWHFKGCGFAALASAVEHRPRVKHVVRTEEIEIGTGRSADAYLATLDRLPTLR